MQIYTHHICNFLDYAAFGFRVMTEMRIIVGGAALSQAICGGVGQGRERRIRIHGRARPRVVEAGLPVRSATFICGRWIGLGHVDYLQYVLSGVGM